MPDNYGGQAKVCYLTQSTFERPFVVTPERLAESSRLKAGHERLPRIQALDPTESRAIA
ncbi:hypothetical protein D3C72_1952300 [compost metagenome]